MCTLESCNLVFCLRTLRSNSFCSKLFGVRDYSTPPYLLHSLSPLPVETKRLSQSLVIHSLSIRQHLKFRIELIEGPICINIKGTCEGIGDYNII